MINMHKPISFTNFYLTEFFNKTIDKSKEVISPENFEKLKELSRYLVLSEDVISGLEKLAQYQGTNEFAIFLFDMIDHIDDYSPLIVYDTLPDLVEDFVNLYSLMIEDQESVKAVDDVINLFRQSVSLPKEVVEEKDEISLDKSAIQASSGEEIEQISEDKQPEKAAPEIQDELLTLKAFYYKHAQIVLDKKLEKFEAEKRSNYRELVNILSEFNKNTNKEEQDSYDGEIKELASHVNVFYPKQFKKSTAIELIDNIEVNAGNLLKRIEELENRNSERFYKILETNSIFKIEEDIQETEKAATEDQPASIDNLLAEYFNTEVSDHLQTIQDLLDDLKNESSKKKQIKNLRKIKDEIYALKELSMIHGYSGFEHITSVLAGKLDNALKGDIYFTVEVYKHFKKVLKSLSKVDKFLDDDNSGKAYNRFNEECDVLITLITTPISEKEERDDETEEAFVPAEKPVNESNLIAFEDNEEIYPLMKELFVQVGRTLKDYHKDLNKSDAVNNLFALLYTVKESTRLLNSALVESFWQPLINLYNKKIESGENNFDEVAEIWDKFTDLFVYPLDMQAIAALFAKNVAFDAKLLGETFKKYWLSLNVSFVDKNRVRDKADLEEVTRFFALLLRNISLFKLHNYDEPIKKMKGYFENINRFDSELVNELDHSFLMMLERLELKGADSNCDDIIDILENLFGEENNGQPAKKEDTEKEQTTPDKPAESVETAEEQGGQHEQLSEEEEVEKIFLEEFAGHVDKALTALENFKKNMKRSNLNTIENEIHTIKSSASLLNKRKVVDISNSIEDVAELFGQSSIPFPENLVSVLDNGLAALNALVNDDNTKTEDTIDALDSLLDQVVIDESAELQKETLSVGVAEEEDGEKISENVDDELLEIFKQESEANIIAIEDSLKILQADPENKKAIDEIESSIHSLKSAAKMLGFREIGQLSDSIESVIEELKSGKLRATSGFCASMSEAINFVKKLSQGEGIKAGDLAKITTILDHKDFPDVEEETAEDKAEPVKEDGRFKDVFIEEAMDLMETLNDEAVKLGKKPEDAAVLNNILRNLHTFKGSALMAGYEKLGELSHKLEDYLELYGTKDKNEKLTMLDPLFDVLDIMQDMLDALSKKDGTESIPNLMTRLAAIDNQIFQIRDKSASKETEQIKPALKPIRPVAADGDNAVKVSTTYLDALVNMSTELVVNRTELSSHIEKLKKLLGDADLSKRQIRKIGTKMDELFSKEKSGTKMEDIELFESPKQEFSDDLREFTGKVNNIIKELNKLYEAIDRDVSRIDRVSKVLHDDILKTRMVPVSTLFVRYPKAVHDLARKQGKKINLEITDNNVELDRAMVSALSDPILHILRNAVDHGIETPEERSEQNKSETAHIATLAHARSHFQVSPCPKRAGFRCLPGKN